MSALVMSHGVMVRKGVVKAGDFVKSFNSKRSDQSYYDGSWEELEALVIEHFDDNEPGTGSVDGDVLLVRVPAGGFIRVLRRLLPRTQTRCRLRLSPVMMGRSLF